MLVPRYKIDSSKNFIIVFYFEQIFTLFFDQRQENDNWTKKEKNFHKTIVKRLPVAKWSHLPPNDQLSMVLIVIK